MTGKGAFRLLFVGFCLVAGGCLKYQVAKATVAGTIWAVRTTYRVSAGAVKAVYHVGGFTYEVVKAPIEWSLTEDIEAIDGLPPKEAIRLDRVAAAPYTVNGRTYYPISVEQAKTYRQIGAASWYGAETLDPNTGYMTANGEAFDPEGLTAAHRNLPIPVFARVTNLDNGASIVVRVNDRGPFPKPDDPPSTVALIALSPAAARKLGFYDKGTTQVRVETLQIEEK